MSTINWKTAVSGNFTDGTKWLGGVVPGAGDDAVITVGGTYTVSESGAASVNSLSTGSGVTFNAKSGLFSIGAGTSTIAGLLEATSTGSLSFFGSTVANSGTIKAADTASSTISNSNVTNTGTISETGGGTLTLYEDVITSTAGAHITASGTHSVIVFSATPFDSGIVPTTVVSGGTLTASSGGSFQVAGVGGVWFDGDTTQITLSGGLSIGGASATSQMVASGSIDNSGTITVTDNGGGSSSALIIFGGSWLGFSPSGTLTLTGGGHVVLQDNAAGASAILTGQNTGGNSTSLLTNVDNIISGAGFIGLPGNNGISSFTLDNQAAGTINANQAHGLLIEVTTLTNEGLIEGTSTGGLTISESTVTNTGTFSETAGGTLTFYEDVITSTAGAHITVSGTNSVIMFSATPFDSGLVPTTVVSGGTLTASSGGSFQVAGVGGVWFDGDTTQITLSGGLSIGGASATSQMVASGSIDNSGTITVTDNGGGSSSALIIFGGSWLGFSPSGTLTLTGGGHVVLQDNAAGASAILTGQNTGGNSTSLLTNVDNIISGAGFIGLPGNNGISSFTLDNQAAGTINANQAHGLLIEVTTLTNEGLIEGTSTGGLTISESTVTNTGTFSETAGGTLTFYEDVITSTAGAHITVSGTNSVIMFSATPFDSGLVPTTVVSGGTLTASSGGSFQVAGVGGVWFDGDTTQIALSGGLSIGGASATSQMVASGSIDNSGTITVTDNGGGGSSALIIFGGSWLGFSPSGTLTLTGGGHVVLQDNAAGASAILTGQDAGGSPSSLLTNVDNTISGAGSIGLPGNIGISSFTLDNQSAATINANQAHGLDINVSTLTNEGLIEVTSAGGLTIEASSFTNTGTLTANGGNLVVSAAVTGAGNATIGGSSILEFGSTSIANTTFLSGSSATLRLDNSAGFTGTITGFGASNTLDLHDFSSSGASVSYNSGTGQLTVTNASASVSYHLVMPGITSFQVIDDGFGGTSVISA